MDLLPALLLMVDIVGAEVYMILFLLALLLELGIVVLIKSLAEVYTMTKLDLAMVALFVGEASEFLWT